MFQLARQIMDSQNIPRHGVKHRRANSPPVQNQRLVNISDDTWLEALKFLTSLDWSIKRFVSRQTNGIVQRNILRLSKIVLDCADMYYLDDVDETVLEKLQIYKNTTVAFDTVMQEGKSSKLFKNFRYIFDAPVDISPENALIDAEKRSLDSDVNICILGSAHEKIPLSEEEFRYPWFRNPNRSGFRKPVLFYAQFNPLLNQYSWNYLAQFLKFIYHPMAYIKNVKMFAVNQNLINSLKFNVDSADNKPRYIQCGSFSFNLARHATATNNVHLSDMFKWMVENVRAETITLPWSLRNENFELATNFLLDPTAANQCASKKINLLLIDSATFLNALIEKFHTIPLVESTIPTIEFLYKSLESGLHARLGPNLIAHEDDSEAANQLYVISNGQNRMRISFFESMFQKRMRLHTFAQCFGCKFRIYSVYLRGTSAFTQSSI